MILYLDTSSLVKLYIDEAYSEQISIAFTSFDKKINNAAASEGLYLK